MSKSRTVTGECHLCGRAGPLSFEHVPPRAAFNDRPVTLYSIEDVLNLAPGARPTSKGTVQQRGAGAHTLCGQCNNKTGSWYGRHFVDWCYQGMALLQRTRGKPTLIYLNYVFPLAILKQIATMFFSINTERFRQKNPELEAFVLDRERKYLSPRYRFFVYFNFEGRHRALPASGIYDVTRGQTRVTSEITVPPYGYLLSFNDAPLDERLFEISHFARFDYNQFDVMELRLPVLPTHTSFPADYRTREQIMADARRDAAVALHEE